MTINFTVPGATTQKILAVLARSEKAGITHYVNHLDHKMDLAVCHMNGCPLDFDKLLACDEATLQHDIFGIQRHISRDTGQLLNHFVPRCAAKDEPAAS